jgi:hypothetical protein
MIGEGPHVVPDRVLELPTTGATMVCCRGAPGVPVLKMDAWLIENLIVTNGRDAIFAALDHIGYELELSKDETLAAVRGPVVTYRNNKKTHIKSCRFFTDGEEWLFVYANPKVPVRLIN